MLAVQDVTHRREQRAQGAAVRHGRERGLRRRPQRRLAVGQHLRHGRAEHTCEGLKWLRALCQHDHHVEGQRTYHQIRIEEAGTECLRQLHATTEACMGLEGVADALQRLLAHFPRTVRRRRERRGRHECVDLHAGQRVVQRRCRDGLDWLILGHRCRCARRSRRRRRRRRCLHLRLDRRAQLWRDVWQERHDRRARKSRERHDDGRRTRPYGRIR